MKTVVCPRLPSLIVTDIPAVDTSAFDGILLKPLEKNTLVTTIGELIPQRAES